MTKPTVSVIVPVYNVAPYLTQCIDSVLGQTFSDFELLLIDDGSTDQSPVICDSYAKRDVRLHVIHQPNRGLSAARNTGLSIARGEFVTFVDSDDWLDLDTLSRSLAAARQDEADVVLWAYIREYTATSLPKQVFDFDAHLFDGDETRNRLCRRMVGPLGAELAAPENGDSLVTAWGKLYRRELLESTSAAFVSTAAVGTEDALFNIQVFTSATRAVYLNQFLSHYRRDNYSSLTQTYKPRLPQQWDELHSRIRKHINEHDLGEDFEQALRNRISLSIIGLGLNAMRARLGWRETVQVVGGLLDSPEYKEAVATLELSWFPLHWRLFFSAARGGDPVTVYALLRGMQLHIDRRGKRASR